MKRNMIETLLGAIVLVIAVVFFVYGTGKANVGDVSGGYTVKAQFTDIGALNQGDDVKISGVKIGTVAHIGLDPVLYNAEVSMNIASDVELPYDTSARISSKGLLGGAYLALDIGGDTEMLEEGDVIAITQSAQNLEQLLGKFIFSLQDAKKDDE
ncbi:MAG: outer membrane lipid asymmetry maintenance protein MlaD [Alphaproteobacteria bacterium]|nr:MAG: outer membrane lipid asymmetry maintenance protein MlaD [Alphaproteobacteria bacterium]